MKGQLIRKTRNTETFITRNTEGRAPMWAFDTHEGDPTEFYPVGHYTLEAAIEEYEEQAAS